MILQSVGVGIGHLVSRILVLSSDGKFPFLNFQRRDRSYPPVADSPDYWVRSEQESIHSDMLGLPEEYWNRLPAVINDRESEDAVVSPMPVLTSLMNRQQVIAELRYLATVEHALCVEYLYAHYSLNARPFIPVTPGHYSLSASRTLSETSENGDGEKIFGGYERNLYDRNR